MSKEYRFGMSYEEDDRYQRFWVMAVCDGCGKEEWDDNAYPEWYGNVCGYGAETDYDAYHCGDTTMQTELVYDRKTNRLVPEEEWDALDEEIRKEGCQAHGHSWASVKETYKNAEPPKQFQGKEYWCQRCHGTK